MRNNKPKFFKGSVEIILGGSQPPFLKGHVDSEDTL